MEVFRAYCSAVDRNVPVALKAGAADRDPRSLRDPADLICLDYRVRCTGWCCPLFSVEDDDAPRLTAPDPDRPGPVSAVPASNRARESRRWAPPM